MRARKRDAAIRARLADLIEYDGIGPTVETVAEAVEAVLDLLALAEKYGNRTVTTNRVLLALEGVLTE